MRAMALRENTVCAQDKIDVDGRAKPGHDGESVDGPSKQKRPGLSDPAASNSDPPM
jgi:hypothetical protein